jgi:hypothetical protein
MKKSSTSTAKKSMSPTTKSKAEKLAKFYANSPQWQLVSLDKLSPQGVKDAKSNSPK